MPPALKRFKFGWYGDGGLGERLIQEIIAGRKTATSLPAYETEDSDLVEGDGLDLLDKRGRSYATLIVTKVEIRLFSTFDEDLARACGHTLEKLRELARFANGRDPLADEEMRVIHFRLVSVHQAPR